MIMIGDLSYGCVEYLTLILSAHFVMYVSVIQLDGVTCEIYAFCLSHFSHLILAVSECAILNV